MPTIAEHCPTQSKGAGRDGERQTFVSRYSATSPTGKLMKKIMRQLSNVRKPPTTGPADEATAAPSDQIAIARARCLALEYDSRIRASDAGSITAAPAPCARRASTSTPSCGASPQAAEAATKVDRPTPNAWRAPIRSESAPAGSRSAANMSV